MPTTMLAERVSEAFLRQVIQAQESERARVARDLHDEIGQALTSLLLGLHLVEMAGTREPADPSRLRELTGELRGLVTDALEQVRRLAFDLRPTVLDDLGLAAALQRLAREQARRFPVEVVLALDGDLSGSRLPEPVETVVYRVVQEALTNVARHAHAGRVAVSAQRRPGRLLVTVADDGVGFDPEPLAGSRGLAGMRERAALVGGSVQVESGPGGTTVRLEVPDE